MWSRPVRCTPSVSSWTGTFALVGLDWHVHVEIDPRYFRPTEVNELRGDASRAARDLGWASRTSFHQLVRRDAFEHDLREAGLDPDRLVHAREIER